MFHVNYGEKNGQGFVAIFTSEESIVLYQKTRQDVREWLISRGIELDIRTKDRLNFVKLLPYLLVEIGLDRFRELINTLKTTSEVVSNEAVLSMESGYSAEQRQKAMTTLFPTTEKSV